LPNPETHNQFTKGLNKDLINYLMSPQSWSSAKNVINSTQSGDLLSLSTESANELCVQFPYPLIGAISLDGGVWMVFLTDNTSPDPTVSANSEIGIVDTDNCTYTKFSNSSCLNFSQTNLITGASRRNFDCGFNVYWSDGKRNPDRYVDTDTTNPNNLIWVQNCTTTGTPPNTCTTCVNTDILNCDNIRIAPLVTIPCVSLSKSFGAGNLENGMYQIAVAYVVNDIKVTDYLIVSNSLAVWSHNNVAGAITATITNADNIHFKQMLVTVISYNNSQLVARKLGIYDTTQQSITIDSINQTLPVEQLSNIPLQTPLIEKSDSIWSVNNYLLRNGISERPDINYQPQANLINTSWVLVEYPEQYYKQTANLLGGASLFSGTNYSFLGDEQYCLFIRWVYTTGDKTASYHIPGRAFLPGDAAWATRNTAFITSLGGPSVDGGTLIARGQMGYWESTEKYPSNQASVWGTLCGTPIRHHKFPDQTVSPALSHFRFDPVSGRGFIRAYGIQLDNITHPLDNTGNPITDIVGYEILRGSREGNKSIIAKGIINNMWEYTIPGTGSGGAPAEYGLFQNFPANDLRINTYLTWDSGLVTNGGNDGLPAGKELQINTTDHGRIHKDIFSFHSPDTSFQHPYLGSPTLKTYQGLSGKQIGYFTEPYKHPLFKLPSDFVSIITDIIAVAQGIADLAILIGGDYDAQITASDDINWQFNMGYHPNYTTDYTGAFADIQQGIAYAVNIAMFIVLEPFKLAALQQQLYHIIKGLIPGVQYANQFNGHSYYNQYHWIQNDVTTRQVVDYEYIEGGVQTFGNREVNNLFRNNCVTLQLDNIIPNPEDLPSFGVRDISRYTRNASPANLSPESKPSATSCYYSGLKVAFPSQYGQIGSVNQIPLSGCWYPTIPNNTLYTSPILFGGDTYINRYTEKNPMFFFNDWLGAEGQIVPEDYPYNYRNYINVPYPAYWVDNQQNPIGVLGATLAHNFRRLDGQALGASTLSHPFYVSTGFFYLFCNGVRDFYVESDVNVGFRDWEDEPAKRFYDPYGYTDLSYMFRSDIIKSDPFYKYDYSLSVNKFYSQYISFGQTLERDYDPNLAYTCFAYYPRRIAYSLPQNEEQKVDNWRQFLANNYYDFPTPVRAIKSISKTGALFMLDEASPVEFTGVQVLQQGESANTAITIGDGGLFNQALQNVVNTERGISYGSCKSKFSAINTQYGLFWVSQQAGAIFNYTGKIDEISNKGLRWWFSKYLPSQLLAQFPNFAYPDNPVIGVGIQTSYDETNDILYISKKDYSVKPGVKINYIPTIGFYVGSIVSEAIPPRVIPLGDPQYFEDASWTISYCCKNQYWISYHSWLPDFSISGRNHNFTSKLSGLWKHNSRTDRFSAYYGTDYPMHVELIQNTPPDGFTTYKNIEYVLDAWKYKSNGYDRFLQYDDNFSTLILYNNEQVSGLLNLVPKPTNPYDELNYPVYGTSSVDVLYGMKERKYRINMFADLTNDRGEFTNAEQQAIVTSANGVDWQLNPLAIDYNKPPLQQKKFRGEFLKAFLQKNFVGQNRLQLYIGKSNNQNSQR